MNDSQANDSYKYGTLEEHRACQQKIAVEGGEMAYIDLGEGTPILLVHGVPTSSWLYRFMIDGLLEKGYRVIAPDLLGFGNSDKPKGYEIYEPKRQAKRLQTLMTSLKIDKYTLVMHDMGGLPAMELVQMATENVERIVILNTILYKDGFKPPVSFKKGKFFGKFLIKCYRSRIVGKIIIKNTLKQGTKDKKFTKAERLGYWKPMNEGGHRAVYQFFTSFDDFYPKLPEYRKTLGELDIPIQVIWGEEDKFLLVDQALQLQKDLNLGESVQILEQAVHFIQEEKAGEIVTLISRK